MSEETRSSPDQKLESTMRPAELLGMEEQMMTEYLLGELPTVQREEFENALFRDPGLYHKLMIAEDRLIDDYLCCQLSQARQKRFEQYFLISERRRAKVALGQTFLTTLSGFNDPSLADAGRSPWRMPRTIRGILTVAVLAISCLFIAAYLMVWRG
jgi:anti-sigma factor RsiW